MYKTLLSEAAVKRNRLRFEKKFHDPRSIRKSSARLLACQFLNARFS